MKKIIMLMVFLLLTTINIKNIVYAGWYHLSEYDRIHVSEDTVTWELRNGTIDNPMDIEKYNGYYYIASRKDLHKTNDFTNYSIALTTLYNILDVFMFNGKIAVMTEYGYVYSSNDGIAWNEIRVSTDGSTGAICVGSGRVLYLSRKTKVYESTDLENWAYLGQQGMTISKPNQFVKYNNKYIISGRFNDEAIYITEDFINWARVELKKPGNTMEGLSVAGGNLYMVNYYNRVYYTTDLFNYNNVSFNASHGNVNKIIYNGNGWVAYQKSGGGYQTVYRSSDGINFTSESSPVYETNNVVYINEVGRAINITSPAYGKVVYSNTYGFPDLEISYTGLTPGEELAIELYGGYEDVLQLRQSLPWIPLQSDGEFTVSEQELNYIRNDDSWYNVKIRNNSGGVEASTRFKITPWAKVEFGSPYKFLYGNDLPPLDISIFNFINGGVTVELKEEVSPGTYTPIKVWEFPGKSDGFVFIDNVHLPIGVGTGIDNTKDYNIRVYDGIGVDKQYVDFKSFIVYYDKQYIGTNYYTWSNSEKDMVIQKYNYGELTMVINGTDNYTLPASSQVFEYTKENLDMVEGVNTIKIYDGATLIYNLEFTLESIDGAPIPDDGELGDSTKTSEYAVSIRAGIKNKIPVQALYNSFVRLKTLSTQEYTQMRPNITINLYEILKKATEHIAPGMNLESIPNEDRMFIDFSHLENIDFAGMSIIEWFRMIIGAFMVYITATYFWHSIIPPRVVE